MHCDYPNHSLVHPPEWDSPEAVEMIVYLNDYDECEGATAVVPRHGPDDPAYPWPITQTPGVGDLDYVNDRLQAEVYMAEQDPKAAAFRAEHLYPREEVARYRFGSVLLYRHDTWHRGRPVKPGTLRLVQNLTFTKSGREWLGPLHPGWSWSMYRRDKLMEKLIAQATVAQRTKDLLLIDEEIRRQYRDGSLTVKTVRRAVATSLGVDEEAIRKVVNATLILGTPRRYLLDQVRAELREQDDGNDSDVGAYFELSDDDND